MVKKVYLSLKFKIFIAIFFPALVFWGLGSLLDMQISLKIFDIFIVSGTIKSLKEKG